MTKFDTEIETDVPAYMSASGATATLSDLKSCITQHGCREIVFGINFDAGFDSLIAVRRLYTLMIDGVATVVLTGRSCYPGHISGRLLSFRHENIERRVVQPTPTDILDVNLSHDAPVFCGVKRSFSDCGPHVIFGINRFGAEVLYSLGPKSVNPDVKRKTTWHVNTDILSLWCDAYSE